jgi:hypothetical protein
VPFQGGNKGPVVGAGSPYHLGGFSGRYLSGELPPVNFIEVRGFPVNYRGQSQVFKIIVYHAGNFFPYRVAAAGYYMSAIFQRAFITGGKRQLFPRRDQYILDGKAFKGFGETKASAGPPHGADDAGFSQSEKNLFQKNRRYFLNRRKVVNGYRSALILKPRKRNGCP